MNIVRGAFRQGKIVGQRYMPKRFGRLRCSIVVLGIGSAGGNIISEIRSIGALDDLIADVQWIHIDTGPLRRSYDPLQDRGQVMLLSLAQKGTGGRVDLGRALARKHRNLLMPLLAHVDIVIIVAGMGGGTGTGISPVIARFASAVGALTIAAVTTPFGFESARLHRATNAIRRLRRKTAFVFTFSNQQLALEMGDDALLDTIYEVQTKRIAYSLCELLVNWRFD